MNAELPADVAEWAKAALLDTIAVQLAGTQTQAFEAVLRVARTHHGESSALGTDVHTSTEWAAHAGAVAASVLDYDDGHYRGGGIHAGSTVIPTLLAAADNELPLEALLAPLVTGYEVAIRFGYLNSPAVTGEGYRASGYAAALGATAALAEVRGLDADATATAIRISQSHAPHSAFVSGAARESIGWAAATAITSVDLAAAGFGSNTHDSAGAVPGGPSLTAVFADLPFSATYGSTYESLRCYVKPYAACRAGHAMLDALLELATAHPVADPADIRRVEVAVVPAAASLDLATPQSLSQAQFALPWLAAVALLRGRSGLERIDPADFAAADVAALAARITLLSDPTLDGPGYPACAHLFFTDGTKDSRTVNNALGSVENPLDADSRHRKAAGAIGRVLDPEATAALIETVLAATGTVGQLRSLINKGPHQCQN